MSKGKYRRELNWIGFWGYFSSKSDIEENWLHMNTHVQQYQLIVSYEIWTLFTTASFQCYGNASFQFQLPPVVYNVCVFSMSIWTKVVCFFWYKSNRLEQRHEWKQSQMWWLAFMLFVVVLRSFRNSLLSIGTIGKMFLCAMPMRYFLLLSRFYSFTKKS